MFTATGIVPPKRPKWSIFEVAKPITDLPNINSEPDWTGGVSLEYRDSGVDAYPAPLLQDRPDRHIDGVNAPAGFAALPKPADWPHPVVATSGLGDDLLTLPNGHKSEAGDPDSVKVRPYFIYTKRLNADLIQQWYDLNAEGNAVLEAFTAKDLSRESVTSKRTRNFGLSRIVAAAGGTTPGTAADVSPGAPASPLMALEALYQGDADNGGNGEGVVHAPFSKTGFLVAKKAAYWTSDGELRDTVNRNKIHRYHANQGPLSDLNDLDSARTPVNSNSEGWLWLSPDFYVGVTSQVRDVDAATPETKSPRGVYTPLANEEMQVLEIRGIVAQVPQRTLACHTLFNESV